VGVALGLASTHVIATQFNWPTHVSGNALTLAFGVAASIGLVFGYYPARRAARLDPIDALRFE
jgi:ABC-type antimicrobial peptide transport system permease subunit